MEHVHWTARPRLDQPTLVAAFEGWNDAGDAATTAAEWLRTRWAPDPVAEIEAEDFFDFTTQRPQVRLVDGLTRELVWPSTTVTAGSAAGRDVVVLVGTEPALRWRTFCQQVVDIATALDVRMVVTLGALLAEVPHSRPVSVIGTATDQALIDRLALRRSSYEGPTGIVGALGEACSRVGLPSATLWAAVPAYVPGAPSPKAALALVERTAELLAVPVVTTDLEIASAAYERQVTDVVTDDEEMTEYVERLEARYESGGGDDDELTSTAGLVEEVERFLRDQRGD